MEKKTNKNNNNNNNNKEDDKQTERRNTRATKHKENKMSYTQQVFVDPLLRCN